MVSCSKCGRVGEGLAPDFTEHTDGEWYCGDCYDFLTKDDKCGCDKPPKEVFGEPVANFGIIMTALLDIKHSIRNIELDMDYNNKHLSKWLEDFAKIIIQYLKTVDDHMSLFRGDYHIPKLDRDKL